MSGFQTIFNAYGGDNSTAMGRFFGNEGMYLRFLDMFFQDESFQQLENALDAGDLKDAFAAAHTLKGVAGNMGLTPFYEAVCVIVERLRTEEPRKDYPVLCKAIQAEFYRAELFRKQLKKGGESVSYTHLTLPTT